MAFCIRLNKTGEDDVSARYEFEGDQGRCGLLGFNKLTGEAFLIEPMPDDASLHCFRRAAVQVTREWSNGVLPEFLEWAS